MTVAAAPVTTTTSASQPSRASATLASNFDGFLKLLATQLENQDPLEPLDATQFTNQLVQFTTVEQAIKSNDQLEKLTGLIEAGGLTSALGMIGLEVGFDADQVSLPATGEARFGYQLAETAEAVTVTIRDARGTVVRVAQGQAGVGDHVQAWDGRGADGRRVPAGNYTVEVAARDAAGAAIEVGRATTGRVDGVETGTGGLSLVVGGVPVSIDKVRQAYRPAAA